MWVSGAFYRGLGSFFQGLRTPLTLENPADALGPGTILQTHPEA